MKTKYFYSLLLLTFVFSCAEPKEDKIESTESFFELENPLKIGDFNNISFYEGGFSGIVKSKSEPNVFYSINDRGPNVPLESFEGKKGNTVKLFPFPYYNQKITKFKIENNELKIISAVALNFMGEPITGLPIPSFKESHQEVAWTDTLGTELPLTNFGLDLEAITLENDSIAWLAEEYHPAILKVNLTTGNILSFYTPNTFINNTEKLSNDLKFRKPNRGFEAIAYHNNHVYAAFQSPLWNPSKEIGNNSRICRIVKLNTLTNNQSTFLYEMDSVENIKAKNFKIGDMAAINESQFLILEHASNKETTLINVYLIDTKNASELSENFELENTFEAYNNAENLKNLGVKVVDKKLVLNLVEAGFNPNLGKPEGLTIINDSTIAVLNDNDYGIDFDSKTRTFYNTGIKTTLQYFKLNQKLDLE